MKYFLPNQNFGFLQTNRSDRLGSLWASKNIDFQKKLGTLKLANKLVTNTTSTDDEDLGLPVAFEFFYNKWFAICGNKLFKQSTGNGDLTTGFIEDDSAYQVGDGTSRFDITNPSGTTFRYTWDGTGTDPLITALTFPVGGTVGIFSTDFAAGNTDFVKTITASGSNYFEITNSNGVVEADKLIGSGFLAVYGGTNSSTYSPLYSDLATFNNNIWATTTSALYRKEQDADNAYFGSWYKVDSFSSGLHKIVYFKKRNRLYYLSSGNFIRSVDTTYSPTLTGEYTLTIAITSGYPRVMVADNQNIWIGSIKYNNAIDSTKSGVSGSIFQWDGISNQITNEFVIDGAGILSMFVKDNTPYAIDTLGRILVFTGYSFKEIARFPLNGQVLLNSNSVANTYPIHFNGITSTENNTLLISVNNLNGDASGSINENLPSGIWELDLSNNNLTHKYSPTLKTMSSSTVTDFGQNRVLSVGAIKYSTYESDSTSGKSNLLAGFGYYTDATTSKYGIFIDSPKDANTDLEGQKRGYFVTTWFESFEITETWKKLWAVFKKFGTVTDKLIFKYRLDEEDPIESTITWTSTTTFTTTTDISDYVGYEAEIIQGTGSGACANILTVTELAGTYTATIDTAITGVTGTSKARFQKWIKLGEVSGSFQNYKELPVIDKSSTRIQIKGILEWIGDSELHKMIINSTPQIKIES